MRRMTLGILVLMVAAAGCGDDGPGLYIRPFNGGGGVPLVTLQLVTGQSHTLQVELSQTVGDLTYVDVTNEYGAMVSVNPMSLKYRQGDKEKNVTILGEDITTAEGVPVIFTIRDTTRTKKLTVVVSGSSSLPDGGAKQDSGVIQDQGTSPDSAADAGMAADSGAMDAGGE